MTEPLFSAVTTPVVETVAMLLSDELHVAEADTSCEVPFELSAVATNCEDEPTAGAVPVTATADTVGAVGDEPQAATESPRARAKSTNTTERGFI